MDDGYTPTANKDVVTLEYLNAQVLPPTPDIQFVTTESDIAPGVAGQHYFLQVVWSGGEAIMEFTGYAASPINVSALGGTLYIANCVGGTYDCTITLREKIRGQSETPVLATLSYTWNVQSATELTDAAIETVDPLPAVIYGSAAFVGLSVSGSGPYTLALKAGALPAGLALVSGQRSAVELAQSFVEGTPTQEGAGVSFGISITGANGVESGTYTFASGIQVSRAPTWESFVQLPIFPASVGARTKYYLTPFVRAYPAITSMSTTPALATFSPNLSVSGLAIAYNTLLSVQGQASSPFIFQLEDNGVGSAGAVSLQVRVESAAVLPSFGIVAQHTQLSLSGLSDSALVSAVPDIGQGLLLPLIPDDADTATESGRWLSATTAIRMSAGTLLSKMRHEGANLGPVPYSLIMRWQPRSGQTGTRRIWACSGDTQICYLDISNATSAAPTRDTTTFAPKSGIRTSDTFSYVPGGTLRAIIVTVLHYGDPDYVSSVTVDNGGTPVALTRSVSAARNAGVTFRTYQYFLGSGIPSGTLTVTVNYSSSINVATGLGATGYLANADVRVVTTATGSGSANGLATFTLSASGAPVAMLAAIMANADDVSSLSSGASQARLATYSHPTSSYAGALDARSADGGSAALAWAWGNFSGTYAASGLGISEVSGGTGIRVGFASGTNGSIGWTTNVGSIMDIWSSVVFGCTGSHGALLTISASGVAAATNYTVSSSAICGTLQKLFLGGANTLNYDWRGVALYRGSMSSDAISAGLAWATSQDSGAPPVSHSASSSSLITGSWSGFSGTAQHQVNAFMTFTQHSSRNRMTSGNNRTPNFHNRMFNEPNAPQGHAISEGGTLVYGVRRTTQTLPYLGVSWPCFEFTMWDTMPTWSGNGTTRLHCDSVSPSYTNWTWGQKRWLGIRFKLHSSTYTAASAGGITSTFNIGDMHEVPDKDPPSVTSVGLRFVLNKATNEAGPRLQYRISRHKALEPAVLQDDFENAGTFVIGPVLTNSHIYDLVVNYAEHPKETTDGGSAGTHFVRSWLAIDGVLQNGGNPYAVYTNRMGFNMSGGSAGTSQLNWRPMAGLYMTAGNLFTAQSANNISGIPVGSKGVRHYVFKSFNVPESAFDGITMNLTNALNYLALSESAAPVV